MMMMHHNVQRTVGIGAGILRRLLLRVRGGRQLHSNEVGVGSIHPSRGVHIDELRDSSHMMLLLRLLVLMHGLELSHGHKSRISLRLLRLKLCLLLLLLLLLLILHQQLLLEQLKECWIANEDGWVEPCQGLRLLVDLLLVQGGRGISCCKATTTTGQGWHRGAAATWQLAASCRQCRIGH